MSDRICLLGTGLMGGPMAANIARAGLPLTVWNRSAGKTEPLEKLGATVAKTAAQAVTDADVIITMLADGPTVVGLVNDLVGAVKRGAVWVDMSSTKPEEARAQAEVLSRYGVKHLDAPVSGGTKGAEAATLAIMVGGNADDFGRVRPVFEAMGRPVHVGPSGTGQLSKLANQTIVAVTIGAVAEAMLLAEQGGADPAALRQALSGGFADSVILQQHGARMSEGNFEPGGPSRFQLKDLDNVMGEAGALGVELPVTQHIRDRFEHFVNEMDGGDKDHSGLYLELKARNGMAV